MKKIISGLAAILVFANLHAQISIRPEVGLNLANMNVKYTNFAFATVLDTKTKAGIKGGAYVKMPVIMNFYLEPGLLYSMKGYNQELIYSIDPIYLTGDKIKLSTTVNTLELPINIGYDFNIDHAGKIFLTAGPYLGFALSGKQKADNENIKDHKLNFGSDRGDDMRSFDFGFNFGLGYQIPMGLYLRAQYGFSVVNLAPEKDYGTSKNRVFAVSVGYDLPLRGR